MVKQLANDIVDNIGKEASCKTNGNIWVSIIGIQNINGAKKSSILINGSDDGGHKDQNNVDI